MTFPIRPSTLTFRRLVHALLGLTLLLATFSVASPVAAAVPSDFTDSLVASLSQPTALAFTPDGRMLVTTQGGLLRVYQTDGTLLATALNLSAKLCTNVERGLLGVAVDPDFATNNYIYLYYTFNKFNTCPSSQPTNPNNPVNRVSRFVLPNNNTILTTTETILIDNIVSPNGNHNGGALHFGKDGYLYVSVGDGGADYAGDSGSGGGNDASRDQFILLGKILRITRDGAIPADNPFQGAGTARCNTGPTSSGNKCRETFAWGLRNPFRFAFDPNDPGTRFYINDVGQGAWEEVDLAQAGADYGWNCREGAHTNSATGKCNPAPPNMIDPLFEYQHDVQIPGTTSPTNCDAITGGAFVPVGVWPTAYDGKYLFADYVCGEIFRLDPAGAGTYMATDFATGLGNSSAVHMTFGPYNATQALYYTTYAGGGEVRRIVYTGVGNNPPTAVASANPRYGAPPPLLVNFNATGSSDPDGNTPLVYQWDFGDGSLYGSGISPTHTYTSIGVYTATLTVFDSLGAAAAPVSLRIDVGNTPPVPTITLPMSGTQFYVGQSFTLTGSATDPQDGTLPPSALTWNVLLHHIAQTNPGSAHTHPSLSNAVGNNVPYTAPAPEDFQATALSYIEIQLTATDAWELSATITRTIQPLRVNVTFATSPAGYTLGLNGNTITTTQTLVSWQGYALNVSAPLQYQSGQWRTFTSWSDGGAMAHTISTPVSTTTYTATFVTARLVWLPMVFK